MKHRPSHLKRLEKKQDRSANEISAQDANWEEHYKHERTTRQIKKQEKQQVKAESLSKSHVPKSLDQKNEEQKHRTPVTRERSHNPKPQK